MLNNSALFSQAKQYIPGGVNSPVRAFKGVGGEPRFIEHASGAHLYDVEGRKYIDYIGSWGPMIAGHGRPEVLEAVHAAVDRGLSFGAPVAGEVDLARRMCELVPSLQRVRMVNSGTEATMSAIRLARGYTGRDKIVKFSGCYHGHADSFLVEAGSGVLTLGIPGSPGVPAAVADLTLTLPYNDVSAVERLFAECGDQLAAVIIEPIAGNMNMILPDQAWMDALRALCDRHGSVLIFDEVMTGFRVALGGAQSVYGIKPDLSTFGKVIGGGFPVGAFGGKAEIMDHIAPSGPVYQAGTLSGNPVAMAAGQAMLELISQPGFYDQLAARTAQLVKGLETAAEAAGVAFHGVHKGGMFGLFFCARPVRSFADLEQCNAEQFKRFFHAMLDRGVYLAPSMYEAGFVSAAHTEAVIEDTLQAAHAAFADLTG